MIEVWTDGSALNSDGQSGGWAAIVVQDGNDKYFTGGSYYDTTSNRMELMAVLEGLRGVDDKNERVIVYSDSQYVIFSLSKKWVFRWEEQNWNGRLNSDLWKKVLVEVRKFKVPVEFKWIKGHNNSHYNEIADGLAGIARLSAIKIKDERI